jgi:7-cyano-7-deazaguanine synthase
MSKSVVLLSGGLDSSTLLALVKYTGDEVYAISFSYGSRHEDCELAAAEKIAEHYEVEDHVTISLPWGLFVGGSLTGSEPMPHKTYAELQEAEGPSPTYVPFRNANLISQSVAYALTIGAERVVIGAHAEDAHNFAYPDCTPEFTGAMSAAVYIGTYHRVRLEAPFQHLSKHQIVEMGFTLAVPYEYTWSCYDPVYDEDKQIHIACGKCPTCVGRREAFALAGHSDPVPYASGSII